MTTIPKARGWYPHPNDPEGVRRWFNGADWSQRTTGTPRTPSVSTTSTIAAPSTDTSAVPAPKSRGWHHYSSDPEAVSRWYTGTHWTNKLTGGDADARSRARRLAVPSSAKTEPDTMLRWGSRSIAVPVPGPSIPPVRPKLPYSETKRFGYGFLWSFYTLCMLIATVLAANKSAGAALLCFVIALICANYAYRVWTFRARRLIFFIIF